GAANPASLHNGSPSSRLCHVPSDKLAARPAAKDENLKLLRLRHVLFPHVDPQTISFDELKSQFALYILLASNAPETMLASPLVADRHRRADVTTTKVSPNGRVRSSSADHLD